ncbi:tanabin [Salvelinus alpinus]|uniref:tanabin n=1 Tax=Salvelinus alpinus TaxID=8036 RepID=UPI0039FB8A0D
MESAAAEPRPTGISSLLGVPGLITWDGDEAIDAEVIGGIRPRSSPLPRRRSSNDLKDCELELTLSSSRRVSFADALGQNLVNVKEFDSWDITIPLNFDALEGEKEVEEYYLSSLYTPPPSEEAMVLRVQEQKLELESIKLLHGTTILRGVVRVLNVSFDKMVYIRTSLDAWATHFDLLAEYIPGSSNGDTDCFSFKLTLVPPFGEKGARVDFCLRYETPVGTFWANNSDRNYVMFCHQKVKELEDKAQKYKTERRKSILKVNIHEFPCDENWSSTSDESSDVNKHGGEMTNVNISESQSGALEDDHQKLLIESNQNSSRRNRRKAARLVKVQDCFIQREDETQEKEKGAVEPSQIPQESTFPQETPSNGPEVQPLPPQHRKKFGLQATSDSLATCNKLSPGLRDSTSCEESVKPENMDSMVSSAPSELGEEHASPIPSNKSDLTDQPAALSQNGDTSVSKVEGSALMQMEPEKGGSAISTEGTHSDNTVRLGNSTAGLVPGSQTNSFTFGNVVAPLYCQVFGRVASKSQSSTDIGNRTRGTLHGRDSTGCTVQSYVEAHSRVSADTHGTPEEKRVDQQQYLESNQGHFISGLSAEKESELEPLSEEAGGFPRAHTALHTAAALRAQIPNEDSGLQGPEENILPPQSQIHQDSMFFQTQTPLPNTTLSQTPPDTTLSQTPPDTTLSQTQTLIDTTQGSFLQSQTEMGSTHVSAEMTLQGASGGYERPDESEEMENPSSANTDEWSTGTFTELVGTYIAMLEPVYADLKVFTSTTKVEEKIPAEHQNLAVTCTDTLEEETSGTMLKEDPIVITEWTSLEKLMRKQTDQVKGELSFEVSNTFCNEENRHSIDSKDYSEEEGAMTNYVRDDYDKDTDKVPMSKEEDIHKEDDPVIMKNKEDLVPTENEKGPSDGQPLLKNNIIEKDWEGTVEEEEEEMMGEYVEEGEWEEEKVVVREVEVEMMAGEKELEEVGEVEATEEEVGKEVTKEELAVEEVDKDKEEIMLWEKIQGRVEEEEELVKGEEEIEKEMEDEMVVEEELEELEEGDVKWIEWEEEEIVEEEKEEEAEKDKVDYQNELVDELSNPMDNTCEGKGKGGESTNVNVAEKSGPEENTLKTDEVSNLCYNDVTPDTNHLGGEEMDSIKGDGESYIQTDEPASEKEGEGGAETDNASTESLSDDEMELYMHSLRAAQKQRNKDLSLGKRPSISRRGSRLSMPSISESADEASNLEDQPDTETVEHQSTSAVPVVEGGQDSTRSNVMWWRETFSWHNLSKALLYTVLFVVFFFAAYHYDFMACFSLYLLSVIWLVCQGEKQPMKGNSRIG